MSNKYHTPLILLLLLLCSLVSNSPPVFQSDAGVAVETPVCMAVGGFRRRARREKVRVACRGWRLEINALREELDLLDSGELKETHSSIKDRIYVL